MKATVAFVVAATLSVVAAWYRPGDSAHAMGLISASGGRANHPVHLPGGSDRYTLVVTGSVLPPYRGDARVTVGGEPEMSFEVFGSDAAIDLRVRRRPHFEDGTLTGLEPRDRFTVWVVMRSEGPLREGRYRVVFTDAASDVPVLEIPVMIGALRSGGGGRRHGH